MIRLSCADFTVPLLPRTAALTVIRAMGFDAVDIGLFERSDHYRASELLLSPRESAAAVRQELDAAGLRASDVFLQIGAEPSQRAVNDPDASVRAANRRVFDQALEFVEELGVARLTGLPGVPQPLLDPKETFELAAEETCRRVDRASSRSVRYSIEPHLGSICATPAEANRFVESVPGLTLTLDYGHFVSAGFNNAEVHSLCRYASHVHARGGAPGRLQAPVAENTIDFGGMLRSLRDSAYSGYICLEYVWIDWEGCNTTDNVSETLLLRQRLCDLSLPGKTT
jgi:sugar phosphate isomerase/epimerase